MTKTELQTQTNYRRRDTTENFVSLIEMDSYFNEGLRRVAMEYDWEWQQTSASITYVDGSNAYALSSVAPGLKTPIDLFYTDDYEFEYVSPEDFDRLAEQDYNIYSKDGEFLKINSSFGSATLNLNYYSTYLAKTSAGSWQATLSATDDEPIMPLRFQDIIPDYALMRIFQKEGKVDDYSIAKKDFIEKLNLMKREYPSKAKRALTRMKSGMKFKTSLGDRKENALQQT